MRQIYEKMLCVLTIVPFYFQWYYAFMSTDNLTIRVLCGLSATVCALSGGIFARDVYGDRSFVAIAIVLLLVPNLCVAIILNDVNEGIKSCSLPILGFITWIFLSSIGYKVAQPPRAISIRADPIPEFDSTDLDTASTSMA